MGHTIAQARGPYRRFRQLDGSHPWKSAVPAGYVDYPVRRRRGGEVAYFNFALGREMGLLPKDHPDEFNPALKRTILDTFSFVIINEWDVEHDTKVPLRDRMPGTYMATRYLQLQHTDRRGSTSGDGRSVWNGCIRNPGVTWDVSSCGTGVTRLCPATATENRFFKTGNRYASYGCGTAALAEGLGTAIMSEVFHRNAIATERVLAVIAFANGFAINVRASRCLLRPSHFFVHSKRGDLASLRAAIDVYIERRVGNGEWPALEGIARYHHLAEETARTFARVSATFESEYVFCWLDWDGDNILANGGIIDYGSVRQFGLYHREYRFQDVDRMSTTIPEQRRKARHIAQNFAQIRDALIKRRRTPLSAFRQDPVLRLFDDEFERTKQRLFVHKVGFDPALQSQLLACAEPELARLRRAHTWFERARSSRGPHRVPDGLSWNAIYCARDLLRELPARLLATGCPLGGAEILRIAASSYASRRDRAVTPHRAHMAREFQRAYCDLVTIAAQRSGRSEVEVLRTVARRSATINRYDRITGDSIDFITARLIRKRKKLTPQQLYRVIACFVRRQDLRPQKENGGAGPCEDDSPKIRQTVDALLEVVNLYREGL
ncbi:MAG TPA: hypothetical protein VK714_23095 [Myxococcota bacterium]|nr:hypothetical protein [Myxococcota bacterium]